MSIALARKFRLDATSDLTLASGWTQVKAITDLNPEITPSNEDASTYETNGINSVEPTMQDAVVTATFLRQTTAGVYDAGQELVRACVGQFGDAARVGIRWYDKNGGPEAYSMVAIPTWKRSQTAVKNLEAATVTFTVTDGTLNLNISNPGTAAAAPVVLSATPSGVAAGGIVEITGTGFTGTVASTGVKFGSTAATSWIVVSDSVIVAVMPAGTAGAANVTVTNGVGTSNSLSYTRGS